MLAALLATMRVQAGVNLPPAHANGKWNAAPSRTPASGCPDAPVLGNGAVAAAISAGSTGVVFHIDRNDAWVPATGDISACGYDIDDAGGRTLGAVSITSAVQLTNFSAAQLIENGTVTTAQQTIGGGVLHTASFLPRGTDVLITDVWWERGNSSATFLEVVISNEQVGTTSFCHSYEQDHDSMWSSRTLGHPYQNINSSVGRRHFYKAAWATAVMTHKTNNTPAASKATSPAPVAGGAGVAVGARRTALLLPPPPPPPAPCTTFDGDCIACVAAHDNRPEWPGACLQLNSASESNNSPLPPTVST